MGARGRKELHESEPESRGRECSVRRRPRRWRRFARLGTNVIEHSELNTGLLDAGAEQRHRAEPLEKLSEYGRFGWGNVGIRVPDATECK